MNLTQTIILAIVFVGVITLGEAFLGNLYVGYNGTVPEEELSQYSSSSLMEDVSLAYSSLNETSVNNVPVIGSVWNIMAGWKIVKSMIHATETAVKMPFTIANDVQKTSGQYVVIPDIFYTTIFSIIFVAFVGYVIFLIFGKGGGRSGISI